MFTVFKQEILLRLRQGATWGQFLFLLAIAAAVMASERSNADNGRLHANAPTHLVELAGIFCLLAGPIVAAIAGTGILRDYELQVHELFFTSRLKPWQYFFGRYLGSVVVLAGLFLALPLGFWLGTVLPGEGARLGPFQLAPYVFSYFVVLLPGLVLTSALFFVAGALTRNLFAVYGLGVGLFVCYLVAAALSMGVGNRSVAALLDPYGVTLMAVETQYWTPAQKNHGLPSLDGLLLINRLLWTGIGGGVVALGSLLFRFRATGPALRQSRRDKAIPPPIGPVPSATVRPSALRSFLHLVRFTIRQILRSWPYWLFLALGLFLFVVLIDKEEGLTGTALLPTTGRLVSEIGETFATLYILVAAIYAGELCWQDRLVRVAPLVETLPLSQAVVTLARFVAVLLTLALVGVVLSLVGMRFQLAHGVAPDGGAYALGVVGLGSVSLIYFLGLAFCIHRFARSKFVGHVVFVALSLIPTVAAELGAEHPLLDIGSLGSWHYSDLDGFSAYLPQLVGLGAHWLLWGALLLGIALPLRRRAVLPLGVLAALFTGLLLYNFHGLHRFENKRSVQRDQADYERTYRADWLARPQPKIVAADLDMTLWPEHRAFSLQGRYTLKNKTAAPLSELLLSYESDLELRALTFSTAATRVQESARLGTQVWKLATPLAPGQSITLDFTLAWDKPGFSATGPRTDISRNGTFLANLAPRIGYQSAAELTGQLERTRQGLESWQELPDELGRSRTYIGGDSDWVALGITVRTAPDQLALAPGKLLREWQEGGRRCFRYQSVRPTRYFWAVVSGHYATRKATWGGTPVTIYYHPGHSWNVQRILSGATASLRFCTEHFAPYPFGELKIVEFPARGEAVAAQAFAGLIPFSEDGGFTLQVDKDSFDTPFAVAAHEVAHQWWAHQVTGADLPGSELLSESLAEYTALRVAVDAGNAPRDVLKRAADAYLKGRAADHTDEQPLLTTRRQPYLCYQKGSLAFSELHTLTGEALDRVLRAFLQKFAFQEPPYPVARSLVDSLKASFPAHTQRLVELFDKITLCDLTAHSATTKQIGTKRWRTTVVVTAKKVFADGQGNETPALLANAPLTVALWNRTEVVTLPMTLQQPRQTLTFETAFAPTDLILDPNHYQLDRERDDNYTSVK